jgi:hypothetical protein
MLDDLGGRGEARLDARAGCVRIGCPDAFIPGFLARRTLMTAGSGLRTDGSSNPFEPHPEFQRFQSAQKSGGGPRSVLPQDIDLTGPTQLSSRGKQTPLPQGSCASRIAQCESIIDRVPLLA